MNEHLLGERQVHGNLSAARRRALPDGALDLAVNTNPYGPPECVRDALALAPIGFYPDSHAEELVDLWAGPVGAGRDELFFGAGAVDLIWAAVRAFCSADAHLAVVGPTFSEPAAAAAAAGAEVREAFIQPGANIGIEDLATSLLEVSRPGLVYVCEPNNPTGESCGTAALTRLAQALAPTPLLLDESFHSVATSRCGRPGLGRLAAPAIPGVIRLRSLTKDFGMPGIRLGYGTAPGRLAAAVGAQLAPWRISAPAQCVGETLLEDEALDFLEESSEQWQAVTDELAAALRAAGHGVVRGEAPFLLVEVGDGAKARRDLLDAGLHVRDCTSFGLPRFIRVAGRPGAAQRLVEALGDGVLPTEECGRVLSSRGRMAAVPFGAGVSDVRGTADARPPTEELRGS